MADQPYLKPMTNRGISGPGQPMYGQQGGNAGRLAKYLFEY